MILVSKKSVSKTIKELDKTIFIDISFIEMIKLMIDKGFCTNNNKNDFIEIIDTFKEEWIKNGLITLSEYNEILRKILVIDTDNFKIFLEEERNLHINAIVLYKKFNEDIRNFIINDFYVINYLFEPTEKNKNKIEHQTYFSGTINKIFLIYPEFLYNQEVIKNICTYIDTNEDIILKDRKRLLKIIEAVKSKKFFMATNDYVNYKMCMAYLMSPNIESDIEIKLINDEATIDNLNRISIMARKYNCFEEFFIKKAINLCKKINDEKKKQIINNLENSKSYNSLDYYLSNYLQKTNKKVKILTNENIMNIRNSIYYEYLLVDLLEDKNPVSSIEKFTKHFIGEDIFFEVLKKIGVENNNFIILYKNKIKDLLILNMSYIKNDSYQKKKINKRLLKSLQD